MLLTLLMAIASPDAAVRLQPESVRAMVIANCGIDGARLRIDRDEGAAMTTLTVTDSAPLSDTQLGCYGETLAIAGIYMPDPIAPAFEDDRLGDRYSAHVERDTLANARRALREIGLLGRVPRHNPKRESLAAFAIRIERLCGARPGSILLVHADWIDLRDEVLADSAPRSAWPTTFCVMNVATAAGHNPLRMRPVALDEPPVTPVPSPQPQPRL